MKFWLANSPLHNQYEVITCHHLNRNNQANGQGVAVIIQKIWTPFIRHIHRIPGRLIVLEIARLSEVTVLGAVYCPSNPNMNTQKPVMKQIEKTIKAILEAQPEATRTIIVGDWNAVINPTMDRIISYNPGSTHPTNQ
jgi:exonuclease III